MGVSTATAVNWEKGKSKPVWKFLDHTVIVYMIQKQSRLYLARLQSERRCIGENDPELSNHQSFLLARFFRKLLDRPIGFGEIGDV
jgi:hypothetical protein